MIRQMMRRPGDGHQTSNIWGYAFSYASYITAEGTERNCEKQRRSRGDVGGWPTTLLNMCDMRVNFISVHIHSAKLPSFVPN